MPSTPNATLASIFSPSVPDLDPSIASRTGGRRALRPEAVVGSISKIMACSMRRPLGRRLRLTQPEPEVPPL
jgi:hypothetical protein